jgi:hypothetical protein
VSGNLEMIEEVAEEIRQVKSDNVQHNEIANQIVGMAQNFKYKELWTMIQEIKGA